MFNTKVEQVFLLPFVIVEECRHARNSSAKESINAYLPHATTQVNKTPSIEVHHWRLEGEGVGSTLFKRELPPLPHAQICSLYRDYIDTRGIITTLLIHGNITKVREEAL